MNHPLQPAATKPEPRLVNQWRLDGSCSTVDPSLHFPEGPKKVRDLQTTTAVKICESCPVLKQCRTYAIETGQQYGVWGGMSEHQLSLVARRPRQRRAA